MIDNAEEEDVDEVNAEAQPRKWDDEPMIKSPVCGEMSGDEEIGNGGESYPNGTICPTRLHVNREVDVRLHRERLGNDVPKPRRYDGKSHYP